MSHEPHLVPRLRIGVGQRDVHGGSEGAKVAGVQQRRYRCSGQGVGLVTENLLDRLAYVVDVAVGGQHDDHVGLSARPATGSDVRWPRFVGWPRPRWAWRACASRPSIESTSKPASRTSVCTTLLWVGGQHRLVTGQLQRCPIWTLKARWQGNSQPIRTGRYIANLDLVAQQAPGRRPEARGSRHPWTRARPGS